MIMFFRMMASLLPLLVLGPIAHAEDPACYAAEEFEEFTELL